MQNFDYFFFEFIKRLAFFSFSDTIFFNCNTDRGKNALLKYIVQDFRVWLIFLKLICTVIVMFDYYNCNINNSLSIKSKHILKLHDLYYKIIIFIVSITNNVEGKYAGNRHS